MYLAVVMCLTKCLAKKSSPSFLREHITAGLVETLRVVRYVYCMQSPMLTCSRTSLFKATVLLQKQTFTTRLQKGCLEKMIQKGVV